MLHLMNYTRLAVIPLLCVSVLFLPTWEADAFFRSNQEYRTINTDMYEISIARNGLMSLRFLTGENIFDAAHVRIQLADKRDQQLKLPGQQTQRQEVSDRLGQGQGVMFARQGAEWHIRTYPTKPFLAVQAVYTNNSKNAVRVERLTPWAVLGDRASGMLSLGGNAEEVAILPTGEHVAPLEASSGPVQSPDSLVLHNPSTGRSLVAGFITANAGRGVFHLERSENAADKDFDLFRADCVYDPPILLEPGERLESEVLYLGVMEEDVFLGMERFGKAFAVVNGVHAPETALPSGFQITVPPEGEAPIAPRFMDWLESEGAIQGNEKFNTLVWGGEWETTPGSLRPQPQQFPEGLAPVVESAGEKGYRSLLEIAPFVTSDPTLHEDILPTDAWLSVQEDHAPRLAPYRFVLDSTHPAATAYLEQQLARIMDWGFSGVLVQQADAAFYATLPADQETTVQRVHHALDALQDALPQDAELVVSPATLHTGLHADYALIDAGFEPKPLEQMALHQAGLRAASSRFHLTPSLFQGLFQHWSLPTAPNAPDDPIAWQRTATLMALSGGTALLPWRSTPSAEALAMLTSQLPPSGKIARPAAGTQNSPATVWHAPIYRDGTTMHLIGLLHPGGEASQTQDLSFRNIGLDPERYYTVFDLWQKKYHGTAQGQLSIAVAPNNARLLLLKPFENRPLLQYVDNQSPPWSPQFGSSTWQANERTLQGKFQGRKGVPCRILISMPAPWRFLDAFSGPGEMQTTLEDQQVLLTIQPRQDGPIEWEVRFHDGRS